MKRNYFLVLFAVIAVGLVVLAAPPKRWLGFTNNSEVIGAYYTIAGCKREMEKRGGWCGKSCVQYGANSIADCKPLVKVSK
jgi:hypothetical protein